MIFITILILTTLSIAGTAAFFSVYGLAQLFQGMMVPVMVMGAVLEAGKLVAASFLYRYWNQINNLLKIYLSLAVVLLMIITSIGVFGMLSLGYQTDSLPLKEIESKIELLKEEQTQLLSRKKEIDQQIANLPSNYVKGRQRLVATFSTEINHINTRLPEITTEIRQLSTQKINIQAHVGPIVYIAKAFNRDVDDATKWLIMLIVIVFDPLAVALTIGVNVVLHNRYDSKKEKQPTTKHTLPNNNDKTEKQLNDSPINQQQITLTPDELKMLIAEEVKNVKQSLPTHPSLTIDDVNHLIEEKLKHINVEIPETGHPLSVEQIKEIIENQVQTEIQKHLKLPENPDLEFLSRKKQIISNLRSL